MKFTKWIKKEYVEHYHKLIKMNKIGLKEIVFFLPLVFIEISMIALVMFVIAKILF